MDNGTPTIAVPVIFWDTLFSFCDDVFLLPALPHIDLQVFGVIFLTYSKHSLYEFLFFFRLIFHRIYRNDMWV